MHADDPLMMFFAEFIECAEATLDELDQSLRAARIDATPEVWETIVRGFHSLKGNASFFEGNAITPLARAAEEVARAQSESRASDLPAVLDALEDARKRLAAFVAESGSAGAMVMAADEPEPAIAALAAFRNDSHVRFMLRGEDVTEPIAALTAVTDGPLTGEAVARASAALATLSDLARSADAHAAARVLESACGSDPASDSPLDRGSLREALRALSPLIVKVDGPGR